MSTVGFDVAVGAAEHKPAQVDCSLIVLHVGVVVGTTHTQSHTHHLPQPIYDTDSSITTLMPSSKLVF